jgi:hypothetical protein
MQFGMDETTHPLAILRRLEELQDT